MRHRAGSRSVADPIAVYGSDRGEVVLYRAPDGAVTLDVRLECETIWLNLNQISKLFDRDKSVISRHLRNVFKEKELDRDSVVAFFATTAADGKDVYPSIEEKAAHLLYFLIKNHPFVDGNKRIAAALFLWFLQKNRALYRPDGGKRVADNALVAMTLLIAESRPPEKSVLVSVIVNLINKRNP